MCGIAGEIRRFGAADVAAVGRMTDALAARGPDGGGSYAADGVALGHRRLKVIDLSTRGDQPMVDSELGLAVVFNGCIYNYRELRSELAAAGYRFFSKSDTEVLLKAYHYWGEGFVTRLNGMFAMAIAEIASGDVLLTRDRLGIKPLYLATVGDATRFSSTLPSLLAGRGIDTSLDRVALHHYLSFHSVVPGPRTILAGVRKVEPGTLVRIKRTGRTRESRYWQASFARSGSYSEIDPQDWATTVLDLLRVAVRRQTEADVPVGVLLSGGLDSSLLVALLAEAGGRTLPTFSVGFESAQGIVGDEFAYSDTVAEHFGTDHHRFGVADARLVPALGRAIAAMSEPMASHDAVAFYLLSEEVRRDVKVVQAGQGADELFAGYEKYQRFRTAEHHGLDDYVTLFDRTHSEIDMALEPAYRMEPDPSLEFVAPYFTADSADAPLDRVLRIDTEVTLVDDPLKRVDNMSMAWGVETRVPFLDHELVELAVACPPELKLRQGGKGVLKDAARSVLPLAVIDRSKGNFPVPALMALDGAVSDLARDALGSSCARARGVFRRDYVDRLVSTPQRTPLGDNKLWQVAVLELWLQSHGL